MLTSKVYCQCNVVNVKPSNRCDRGRGNTVSATQLVVVVIIIIIIIIIIKQFAYGCYTVIPDRQSNPRPLDHQYHTLPLRHHQATQYYIVLLLDKPNQHSMTVCNINFFSAKQTIIRDIIIT